MFASSPDMFVAFDPALATMFDKSATGMAEKCRKEYSGQGFYEISKSINFKLSLDGQKLYSADHVEVDLSLVDHSEIGTASCQKAKDLLTVMVFHGKDEKDIMAKNFKELNDELVELRAEGIEIDNAHYDVKINLGSGEYTLYIPSIYLSIYPLYTFLLLVFLASLNFSFL